MENMKNPSCLLYGPLQAKFEDRPIPEIKHPHDVIVRIGYTGVCGSDVHFWLKGGIRRFVSQDQPLTMGHEASGTIHPVGSNVTSVQPGDKVSIEPGYPCRRCKHCENGRYNLCPDMKFAAAPPHSHGTLTNLAEGVLMELLAVAVHTVRLADIKPGQRVVVFGAGTVELCCAAVAREFGAHLVISVDLLQQKLDFARDFTGESVGRTAMPDTTLTAEENAMLLIKTYGLDDGADVVLDASGAESSIQTAIYTLRSGGTLVQAGMGKRSIDFPIAEVCEKELSVKGCFRYGPGDFELSAKFVTQKRIKLEPLVTKIYAI